MKQILLVLALATAALPAKADQINLINQSFATWSGDMTITFPAFDSSLGTLTKVEGGVGSIFGFTGLSFGATPDALAKGGTLAAYVVQSVFNATVLTETVGGGAFFTGSAGAVNLGPFTQFTSGGGNFFFDHDFARFAVPWTLTLKVTDTLSRLDFAPGAGLKTSPQILATNLDVFMDYQYTPTIAAVPEPRLFAAAGLLLAGMVWRLTARRAASRG